MSFARLMSRLRRSRVRRLDAAQRLNLCRDCGETFVYPVTWSESGPADWWLLLRCGGCGASRDVVASNAAVDAYDRQLDEEMAVINAAAERMEREVLAAEADNFATALELDLLGADDFR
jgi:transcription elongation factor Elf1